MTSARRRVLIFGLTFLPAFAGTLVIYFAVLPSYRTAVLGIANPVLALLRPPIELEIATNDGWNAYYTGGERRFFYTIGGEVRHAIYLNLALLPALLLATPVPWSRRLRLVGWGLLLLFACHVLLEVGMARTYYHFRTERDAVSSWAMLQLVRGGTLLGVVQWALLTWTFWLPRGAPRAVPAGAVPRNAPCPCGSGAKFKHCCGS